MSEATHLVCAYILDGKGSGQAVGLDQINSWTPEQGHLWVHLDCTEDASEMWLRDHAQLKNYVIDGLLAEESRPRCDAFDDGVLLVLRGVNLNPGAEPQDMVSVRIWIDAHRVITTRYRKLMAVQDIRDQLANGIGPQSTGQLVARLAAFLTERMGPTIEELSDAVQLLEDELIGAETADSMDLREVRRRLIDTRRTAIALRRYINPQREALLKLSHFNENWLEQRVLGRLRETLDRVTRITEELDEVRERSAIVQDELANRLSQRMERTMYVLTIVATVMLPLGFLTGLLGINVGGIPGADTGWAFWGVCVLLAVIVWAEVWIMRRFKWI